MTLKMVSWGWTHLKISRTFARLFMHQLNLLFYVRKRKNGIQSVSSIDVFWVTDPVGSRFISLEPDVRCEGTKEKVDFRKRGEGQSRDNSLKKFGREGNPRRWRASGKSRMEIRLSFGSVFVYLFKIEDCSAGKILLSAHSST